MSPQGDQKTRRVARWLAFSVTVLIFSLCVSLATRTFRTHLPQRVTIQSNSAQAIRQHMDRDAVRWVPVVPVLFALDAPSFYPHVAPAGPPLPVLLFEKSLYN